MGVNYILRSEWVQQVWVIDRKAWEFRFVHLLLLPLITNTESLKKEMISHFFSHFTSLIFKSLRSFLHPDLTL